MGTMPQRRAEPADQARVWHMDGVGGASLELLRASYGRLVFTPHAHEEFLIAVTEGGIGGPVFGGERHAVGPGDVLVLNPEQAHAGGPLTEAPWQYRALYPTADLMLQVAEDLPDHRRRQAQVPPLFALGVVRDRESARRLRRFHLASEDPRATLLQRESQLSDALVWLVARHATRQQPRPSLGRVHKPVRAAREYLDEHADENISLLHLARLAGLSPFHLCRAFHREVGLPPHAYQTQLRVRRAKQLLSDGMPVALCAATAGFYDQAHLTRHFRRTVGVTPGAYAKATTRTPARTAW